MRKLNKQDFIFIGKIILYIVVTFMLHLSITRHFITDNCHPNIGGLGYAGYTCFGYFYFLDKASIYLYTLFLWVTIIPFVKRKYLFPNLIYIVGILALFGAILWTYSLTPVGFSDGLPSRLNY